AAAVSDFTADAVIGDLRHALLRGGERLPASGRRQRWLVWRQGEQVQFRPMATDEAGCYDLMRDGGGFGAMCAALAAQRDQTDAVTRGAEILKDWLERGLVAAIAGAAP